MRMYVCFSFLPTSWRLLYRNFQEATDKSAHLDSERIPKNYTMHRRPDDKVHCSRGVDTIHFTEHADEETSLATFSPRPRGSINILSTPPSVELLKHEEAHRTSPSKGHHRPRQVVLLMHAKLISSASKRIDGTGNVHSKSKSSKGP